MLTINVKVNSFVSRGASFYKLYKLVRDITILNLCYKVVTDRKMYTNSFKSTNILQVIFSYKNTTFVAILK